MDVLWHLNPAGFSAHRAVTRKHHLPREQHSALVRQFGGALVHSVLPVWTACSADPHRRFQHSHFYFGCGVPKITPSFGCPSVIAVNLSRSNFCIRGSPIRWYNTSFTVTLVGLPLFFWHCPPWASFFPSCLLMIWFIPLPHPHASLVWSSSCCLTVTFYFSFFFQDPGIIQWLTFRDPSLLHCNHLVHY